MSDLLTRLRAVEAVIFDLDGTLLASHEFSVDAALRAYADLAERSGVTDPPPTRAQIRAAIGLPWFSFYRGLLPESLHERWEEFHDLVAEQEMRVMMEGGGRIFDGAHEVLDQLRQRGLRLACVSNASSDYFRVALDQLDLRRRFHFTACVGDSRTTKTHLVEVACETMAATRAVMIGDKAGDFEAASAHGHVSLAVTHGYGDEHERALASGRIDSLRELPALLLG